MKNQVDDATRNARFMEVSRAREHLWPNRMQSYIGKNLDVIVDGHIAVPPLVARFLDGGSSNGASSSGGGSDVQTDSENAIADYKDVFAISDSMPSNLSEHIQLERRLRSLRAHMCPNTIDESSRNSSETAGPPVLAGRSSFQIPGQSSKTYIVDGSASVGDIVEVRILGTAGYDLIGTIA
jgi:tRNA A37 methylthiotransferase MiaB